VTSEEVRDQLGEIINRVAYGHERMVVTRRGKKLAALVPMEDLELLEQVLDALEDQIDLPLVRQRLAEAEREGTVTWESIKAEHRKSRLKE
jgi:prevent-host-death family protein